MHVHFSVEYPIKQDILRTNFYFDNISTSERSVIRAPPPHSPGNPRMNPQEGARLKNSWTAGRPQHHGEGLFCIEDGGGNVTWSPQRLSGYFEDAFLTKNTVETSFVNCIHGNPGDGRCGAGKFVAAPESSNKSSGKNQVVRAAVLAKMPRLPSPPAPLGGPRGQLRDVVSPACPGSSLGPLPSETCMEPPPQGGVLLWM
ncbi:uncharacterized protein LOC111947866 isoform X5 [Oryzias latipes]